MPSYKYIRAYGEMLLSRKAFINQQIARAREEKAPYDAVFVGIDGKWRTVGDIKNPVMRDEVIAKAK